MTEIVPIPFSYPALNYHLSIQREFIRQNRGHPIENWKMQIQELRDKAVDVYEGEASPLTITQLIKAQLDTLGNFDAINFRKWINNRAYQKINLADRSNWELSLGSTYERYIHIHPARNGAQTYRAKAVPLKIALAWACIAEDPLVLADPDAIQHLQTVLQVTENGFEGNTAHLNYLLQKLVV